MATNRSFNFLGQQRVDIPHLKMIESGVRYDFDALGYMLAGNASYVVKGFALLNPEINGEATTITMQTAGSLLVHPLASENGSIFAVPSNRANEILDPSLNTRMVGACQPSSTNFIGIDLIRQADPSTADVVQFLVPVTNTETSNKVPLARTLDYQIVISQTDFTYNRSIAPVAIVKTNAQNQIDSFEDARPLLGRLTPGGSVSSSINPYAWPFGRNEDVTSFVSGDKALTSLKSWQNAIMTRLWELGGGEQWYSPTADRNVRLNIGDSVFVSTGESFEVVSGNLHWQGLSISFDNSIQHTISIVDQLTSVTGLTDLADGECIYVDLDRTSAGPLTIQKGALSSLGLSQKPGGRWVVASRIGDKYYVTGQPWPVGSAFLLATTAHTGVIKSSLDLASPNPIAATIAPPGNANEGVAVCTGISRGKTIGTTRSIESDGNLQIGLGTDFGDENIIVKTTGDNLTYVTGDCYIGGPILSVQKNSESVENSLTSNFFDINYKFAFLGAGYSATKQVSHLISLSGTPGWSSPLLFTKQTKTWKADVNFVTSDTDLLSYHYYDIDKTLLSNNLYPFTADGVTPAVNDTILVNVPGATFNGIYTLTTQGDEVSVHAVLTRRPDCVGKTSGSSLIFNNTFTPDVYDTFDGTAVKVAAGDTMAGTYWVLNAPHKAGSIELDGSQVFVFTQTSNVTQDQLCVMFFDGSYTALTTGPEYTVN